MTVLGRLVHKFLKLTVIQEQYTKVPVLAKNVTLDCGEEKPCQDIVQDLPIWKGQGGQVIFIAHPHPCHTSRFFNSITPYDCSYFAASDTTTHAATNACFPGASDQVANSASDTANSLRLLSIMPPGRQLLQRFWGYFIDLSSPLNLLEDFLQV